MNIYSIIQAEKLQDGKTIIVKKGQGSNTHLNINIIDETKALIAHIKISYRKDRQLQLLPLIYFTHVPAHGYLCTSQTEYEYLLKANKQKDNECGHPLCGKTICRDNVPL